MKRTLLGMAAVGLIVGTGSFGVYFARDLMNQPAPEQTPADAIEAPITSSRDMTPIPIAARQPEEPIASANPFVVESRESQPEPRETDRYGSAQTAYSTETSQGADEIPDAAQMPAPRAVGRGSRSRYAEQTVAAEVPETETADVANEEPIEEQPRELAAEPAPVDRYGRPSRSRPSAPEPPADTRPIEEPIAETPLEDSQAGGDEGTGRPGAPQLSGSQAPTLTIEKTAPAEIQIGKPARFLIKVRNTGSAVAQGVEIHDTIPQGTQLIETSPQAKRGAQGTLVWDLGALKPGEEQTAELQLMPMAEGEIGSVATVHFRAEASVRTVATKPMLNMEVTAPPQVMKGDELTLKIKISNPGSGAATGVVLSESVPEGLTHPGGSELQLDVGTLKPGETRELELGLKAAEAGSVVNVVSAEADANLQVEARAELEVIAPQLQLSLTGPKRRYLERNATHNISVSNPGTAPAKDIELVAVLPKELKFIEANNGGQFDPASHSVYWSLEELPPQETGTVALVTLPLKAGDAKVTLKTRGKQGLSDEREEVVTIEGLAAINFQLSDVNDPIEVGGNTSYEVRVTNQGSKAASNVQVIALVPEQMKPTGADGPVRFKIEGQRVVFEPLKQLAPKADTAFTIKVQSLEPGDLRLRVQITTDEHQEPITREESTRVFGDE